MKRCAGCNSPDLKLVLALGSMPPVNSFIEPNAIASEVAFPLDLYFCRACTLAQLGDPVDPQVMFSNYTHLSSASGSNLAHLSAVAERINTSCAADRILEIGANDGSLLERLKQPGRYLLGVDPAENLRPLIESRGVAAKTAFFNESFAKSLAAEQAPFSLIAALNVVAHTPDFISLLTGVRRILAPAGTFFLEAAYVLDTVLRGQFDTIYHEHVYCFSLHSLSAALELAGLRAVQAEVIPTQGTSLRILARHSAENPEICDSVGVILNQELLSGCTSAAAFERAGDLAKNFSTELRQYVAELISDFGPLIGLGAPARGVVILNYCRLGPDLIKVLIDDTPLKQGRVAPGVHIPVADWKAIPTDRPAGYLLLSWNYRDEILGKLRACGGSGKLIIPFPQLEVIDL